MYDLVFGSDSLRYSFMALLQEELDAVANEWNCHHIRQSAHAESPGGVPDRINRYHILISYNSYSFSTVGNVIMYWVDAEDSQ